MVRFFHNFTGLIVIIKLKIYKNIEYYWKNRTFVEKFSIANYHEHK